MNLDKGVAQYFILKAYTARPDKYSQNKQNGPLYSSEDLRVIQFKNRTHKLIRDAGDAYLEGDKSITSGADTQEVQTIVSQLLEQLAKTQYQLDESRKDSINISIQSRKEAVAMAGETQELAKTTVKESNDTARETARESNLTARDSIAAVSQAFFTTPPRNHRGGVDTSSVSRLKKKVVQLEHELKESQESLFQAIELFGEERDRAQHFEEQLGKANNDAEKLAGLCQRLGTEMDSLDMDKELLLEQAEMDREAIEANDEAKEKLKEAIEAKLKESIEANDEAKRKLKGMLGRSGRHVENLRAELKVAFDMMYELRPSC